VGWDKIVARFNPATPIAFGANMPLAPLAHQINLAIPLSISATSRATIIKIAATHLQRDAVKGVRVLRPRTFYDPLFM
jgi:hypothetical protein